MRFRCLWLVSMAVVLAQSPRAVSCDFACSAAGRYSKRVTVGGAGRCLDSGSDGDFALDSA